MMLLRIWVRAMVAQPQARTQQVEHRLDWSWDRTQTCETWCSDRGCDDGPKALRSLDLPLCARGVSARDYVQVATANTLLLAFLTLQWTAQ